MSDRLIERRQPAFMARARALNILLHCSNEVFHEALANEEAKAVGFFAWNVLRNAMAHVQEAK